MRLLYVNDALAIFGGIERILVDKMNLFAEYGYEVYLITLNQGQHKLPFSLHPKVKFLDLDVRFQQQYQYHGLKRLCKRIQLQKLFRKRLFESIHDINPDIIICTRLELMKIVIQVKGTTPLIFESHNSCLARHFLSEKKWKLIDGDFMNRYAKKAQMVVTLTEGDAKEWQKLNTSVNVIPNIVQLNRTNNFSDGHSKSVIFVGRFSEQKDIGSLLRIWRYVYQRHPDWYLHIYGGYGEQQDFYLSEINSMKSNIIVHNPTSEILNEYTKHSMLLLTSRFEPFGLVLPEAMSCGLPVVAFDCPYGPADIITDGVDGFLIKDRDETIFSEKVCWLIEHSEERIKMGHAGILSSQRYDGKRIIPLWIQLFEELLDCQLNV